MVPKLLYKTDDLCSNLQVVIVPKLLYITDDLCSDLQVVCVPKLVSSLSSSWAVSAERSTLIVHIYAPGEINQSDDSAEI